MHSACDSKAQKNHFHHGPMQEPMSQIDAVNSRVSRDDEPVHSKCMALLAVRIDRYEMVDQEGYSLKILKVP